MIETLEIIKEAINNKKGERNIIYDFSTLNPMIDYAVITSAPSLRQAHAIADFVRERLKEHSIEIKGIEGNKTSGWVLVDVGSIIVHVFVNEDRSIYQLEKLYADLLVIEEF